MSTNSSYPKPSLTVDAVLFSIIDEVANVLLIQRARDPFQGSWAFPGGFVDELEPLEQAWRRELLEETGLSADACWPVGAFGDPGRDPRGWTVSVVYYAFIDSSSKAQAGDDAAAAKWMPIHHPLRLAFDHEKILARALARVRVDQWRLPIYAPLLKSEFTIEELVSAVRPFNDESLTGEVTLRRLLDAGAIAPVDSQRDPGAALFCYQGES